MPIWSLTRTIKGGQVSLLQYTNHMCEEAYMDCLMATCAGASRDQNQAVLPHLPSPTQIWLVIIHNDTYIPTLPKATNGQSNQPPQPLHHPSQHSKPQNSAVHTQLPLALGTREHAIIYIYIYIYMRGTTLQAVPPTACVPPAQ